MHSSTVLDAGNCQRYFEARVQWHDSLRSDKCYFRKGFHHRIILKEVVEIDPFCVQATGECNFQFCVDCGSCSKGSSGFHTFHRFLE